MLIFQLAVAQKTKFVVNCNFCSVAFCHSQNDYLQSQLSEALEKWLVWALKSLYRAAVFFVANKGRNFYLFTNYCALNKVIIKKGTSSFDWQIFLLPGWIQLLFKFDLAGDLTRSTWDESIFLKQHFLQFTVILNIIPWLLDG